MPWHGSASQCPQSRSELTHMNDASPLTRRAALTALAAALVIAPRRSWSQSSVPADFPHQPMTLIVPLAAGGPLDVLGRLLAQDYQAR